MNKKLAKGLRKAGVAEARRHLFICLGPKCCDREESEALWRFVKEYVKKSGQPVMRTKADCFRICEEGPLMVVYPEGVWYARVTPERFARIYDEHVVAGKPVAEWVIARMPECGGCFPPKDEDEEDY